MLGIVVFGLCAAVELPPLLERASREFTVEKVVTSLGHGLHNNSGHCFPDTCRADVDACVRDDGRCASLYTSMQSDLPIQTTVEWADLQKAEVDMLACAASCADKQIKR